MLLVVIETIPATIIGMHEYFSGEVSIHIRNKMCYHIREAIERNDEKHKFWTGVPRSLGFILRLMGSQFRVFKKNFSNCSPPTK